MTTKKQICVRLPEDKYQILKQDHIATGLSMPELLKRAYLARGPIEPIMSAKDVQRTFAALKRLSQDLYDLSQRIDSIDPIETNNLLRGICNDFRIIRYQISTFCNRQ